MRIVTTIAEARRGCKEVRGAARTLGLVPTMGALHAGHLSLVRAANESCDAVVASIFVNPTQFAPHEDFARYPRTFERDCELLKEAGVDLVFAPEAPEMYPQGASTFVEVEGLGDRLDGATRPGHFRGVATVVSKLLHIISPNRAFFGQKDAVQAAVLKRMVRDLAFDVELVICPIVREPDGLALSSRNRYLTAAERQTALVLWHSLNEVRKRIDAGEYASQPLIEAALRVLGQEPLVRVDYFAIVDTETMEDLPDVRRGALIAVAAFIGSTRLIDNLQV